MIKSYTVSIAELADRDHTELQLVRKFAVEFCGIAQDLSFVQTDCSTTAAAKALVDLFSKAQSLLEPVVKQRIIDASGRSHSVSASIAVLPRDADTGMQHPYSLEIRFQNDDLGEPCFVISLLFDDASVLCQTKCVVNEAVGKPQHEYDFP